jgi:hypothetical protein
MTRSAGVLSLVLLLMPACVEEQGPADGFCEPDERICASDREFQRCVDGEWGDPQECPPEGEPPFDIRTFCNTGLCTP